MEISVIKRNPALVIAFGLVVLGILVRLLPHVPNFAPVGAIALFGGAILGRRYGLLLPLGVLMVSDALLGGYDSIVFTWLGFLLVALFGTALRRRSRLTQIGLGGFGAATIFFIVSNFGTWVTSGMYAHTWSGLADCFVVALPFFRMTLLSDLFYSGVLFGLYALAVYMVTKARGYRKLPTV